eukprot:7398108-Heterocapsa_arctica.AAC.1
MDDKNAVIIDKLLGYFYYVEPAVRGQRGRPLRPDEEIRLWPREMPVAHMIDCKGHAGVSPSDPQIFQDPNVLALRA